MISWALSSKTSWQLRRAHTRTKRYLTSLFIAVIKHQDPKQLGEKISASVLHHHSLREVVTGTQLEPETGGRSRHRVHGGVRLAELCPVACSVCFLTHSRTMYPGLTPPTMSWASNINHKEKAPQVCPLTSLEVPFSQSSLLENDLNSCHIDIKLAGTVPKYF